MINTVTRLKKILLIIGDITVLYFSLWLTLLIRYAQPVSVDKWNQHFLPFTLIFALWLVIFYINNLFELQTARNNQKFYSSFLKSIFYGAILAVIFFYLSNIDIAPKTNLFIYIFIFTILSVSWRHLFNLLANTKALSSNLIVIGVNNDSLDLINQINSNPQIGFKISCVVKQTDFLEQKFDLPNDINVVEAESLNLQDIIKKEENTTIVTTIDLRQNPDVLKQLYQNINKRISVFDLAHFSELFTGKIPVASIEQIWFLENLNEESKSFYEMAKRFVDFILSLVLLIISLPFIPIIYSVVKINSHGPFIFKQTRVGQHNKNFTAMKIRSMHRNAETNGPQWATKNDNRVTRSGRFMRKTRIDEIPQLINILKGEMSFIGPRPERPEFVDQLSIKIPFYNQRHLVKPGLTGWAQINFPYGASEQDALEKLQYDLYYIKNRSISLDISILLKTIRIVLTGSGQ